MKKPTKSKKPAKSKKPTKSQKNTERSRSKVQRVIKQHGHSSGKLPAGQELHHVDPVAEGGKTTKKNTRIVSKTEHKRIHANRRKKGNT